MSSIDDVTSYIQKKRDGLSKNNDSLDTLSKSSPSQKVSDHIGATASDSVWDRISKSPMSQLGQGYVAEMVSKNGAQLISNVDTIIGNKINAPIQAAQSLVFNTIGAALVAQNDLIMFFLQQVGQQAINAIEQKKKILLTLQDKLRQLHNALALLVAGDPFYNKYLVQLRKALQTILAARNKIVNVTNALQSTDRWLKVQYNDAIAQLVAAEALMEPPPPAAPVNYTNPSLLTGLGITPPNQQIQLIMSIPQLVQEVFAAASGYFIATAKVNLLLLGFIQGYSQLQTVGSSLVKNYTVSTLSNLIGQLDGLISDMANQLNGSPTQIAFPQDGFKPNPTKVSANALKWLLQLKTILTYASFVPGPTLSTMKVSNEALARYNACVLIIKSKNNRTTGNAVLTAKEGQEDIGQLETQLTTFCLASLQAIVDAKTSASILALGRTMQDRCDLSLKQDTEIENALKDFVNAPLPLQSTLVAVGGAIFKMLNSLGLDRALSFLQGGKFSDFFNLNTKTATFAGAALVGIGLLKQCLSTEEDRQQLTQAERVIQRDNTAKQLYTQRGASSGIANQKAANVAQDKQLSSIQTQADKSAHKCNIIPSFPSNMLTNLGNVLGVSAFGGSTLSKSLTKLGRGIL